MVTIRAILARFGSLPDVRRALSQIPGVKAPTVQAISSWQVNGRIPTRWQRQLLAAAKRERIPLTAGEVIGHSESGGAGRAA